MSHECMQTQKSHTRAFENGRLAHHWEDLWVSVESGKITRAAHILELLDEVETQVQS